jgi:hypothetical protein
MSRKTARHLRYGDANWTRCGVPWTAAGDESWPVCGICVRSCRELDKPDPERDTAQTSGVDHEQQRCTLTGVSSCS